MSLLEMIRVTDVRNLVSVTLTPSPSINILYGVNGSGKTSFLEAVHLLGTARSFRSSKVKPVIRQGQDSCTVFGKVSVGKTNWAFGVARFQDSSCKIHINGERAQLASDLAARLPLQVINPDTFRLLEGGPRERRQFLDWGVFHVEHRFLKAWKRTQKAMKQRNALLRHGKMDGSLLAGWDIEFSQSAQELDQYRQSYFARLRPVFEQTLSQLTDLADIQIHYTRGWDKELSLCEVLKRSLKRDLDVGYTHQGPHRADIRIRHQGAPAVESLSRGQQKAVVCALKLAQGRLFRECKKFGCVYLIDDLPSELDSGHQLRLCRMLVKMDAQIFITSVEQRVLTEVWGAEVEPKMFHVEHGVILEASSESKLGWSESLIKAGEPLNHQ